VTYVDITDKYNPNPNPIRGMLLEQKRQLRCIRCLFVVYIIADVCLDLLLAFCVALLLMGCCYDPFWC
jgi:hypothetical protein